MRTFAIVFASLLFVMTSVTSALDECESRLAPIPDELVSRLKNVVLKAHPEAKCDLKDGELICEYRTQTFMIHGVDRGGEVSEIPHEEVGPKDGGFIVKVAVWKARPLARLPVEVQVPLAGS